MRAFKFKYVFADALMLMLALTLAGCTGGSGGASGLADPVGDVPATSPIDSTPDEIAEEPPAQVINESHPVVVEAQKIISDPQIAVNKVQEVQSTLQADPQYAFVSDDLTILEEEGLIDSDSDLKGWVK